MPQEKEEAVAAEAARVSNSVERGLDHHLFHRLKRLEYYNIGLRLLLHVRGSVRGRVRDFSDMGSGHGPWAWF